MRALLRYLFTSFKYLLKKLRFYLSVNWIKTLIFNFKMLPFKQAIKLPVIIYGPVLFTSLRGKLIIDAPVKIGMIGFGQRFEMGKKHKGNAELCINGTLKFKGHAQISKDYFIFIGNNGYCEFGYMSSLGSDVKLICVNKVVFGNWVGIGYESQVSDSNYHPFKNTVTNEYYPKSKPIMLSSYNSITNRVSLMGGTVTPEHCVVASNSICNKDYRDLGNHILIGGVPAKLIKNNFTRDWELEKEGLLHLKILWQDYKELL